jgi:hypothetical protein
MRVMCIPQSQFFHCLNNTLVAQSRVTVREVPGSDLSPETGYPD